MELHELLEKVNDEESFLLFAKALIADRTISIEKEEICPSTSYDSDHNGWSNTSIKSFLEAAVAWAEDTNFGISQGIPSSNFWNRFASFLYCGKIYE